LRFLRLILFDLDFQVVNCDEQVDLTADFNGLLEVGLKYISLIAKSADRHSQSPASKFWRALLHKGYEILDKVRVRAMARVRVMVRVMNVPMGTRV